MFTKEQIQTMTGPQLVEAHNVLSDAKVKRFASLAAGRKRVAALVALEVRESAQEAALKRVEEESQLEEDAQVPPPKRAGTFVGDITNIAAGLAAPQSTTGVVTDIEEVPLEKKKPKGKKRGVVGFEMAYATADGRSVLQKGSTRRKIFEAVAAAGPAGIAVDALDEQFNMRTRPYLLKLRDQGHIA